MIDLKTMGENIRIERTKQFLTQESLSEKAGITENYLSKIERGAGTASLQTVYSIARALDVSIDYLIGHKEYGTEYKFVSSVMDINNLNKESKDMFIDFISTNIKYFK